MDALRPFAEGVYLHQVVERRDGALTRYLDLPEALATARGTAAARASGASTSTCPLFREELGPFASTQHYLRGVLGLLRREAHSPHLEVETYTWDVLPEEYRREDIASRGRARAPVGARPARGEAWTLTTVSAAGSRAR